MSLELLSTLIDLQGHSFLRLTFYSIAMFVSLCFIGGLIAKVPMTAKPPAERVTDVFYWLLAPVWRMLCRAVVAVLLVACALVWGREAGPSLFSGFGPVVHQPTWLLAVELLLLIDLSSYWMHRLFHTLPFLWRFHAIHHSATKICWSTTARVHPINELFNYTLAVLPAFLLGFPIGMVLAMIPVLTWYAIAAHTDWDPAFGPLNKLFASPRFHRWHHTLSHEGGNKNFSNVFSLWDRLFGSYYLPDGRMPEVFGLDDAQLPEHYGRQLVAPFRPRQRAVSTAPEPEGPSDASASAATRSAAWRSVS